MKKAKDHWEGAQTVALHSDDELNGTSAVSAPIWQTTSFRAGSAEEFALMAGTPRHAEFYTRYGNPTHRQVEATVAALEGGEAALVFGSGMGAIFAAVSGLLKQGDHVVAQRNLYAGTATLMRDVLPRWGIECSFVDQTDAAAFAEADESFDGDDRPHARGGIGQATRHYDDG